MNSDFFQDSIFIHAHPDDESLWTGQGIFEIVNRGYRVKVLYLTDGGRGRPLEPKFRDRGISNLRRQEAKEALRSLGCYNYVFLRDGELQDSGARISWNGSVTAPLRMSHEALSRQKLEEVAGELVREIDSFGPANVISYPVTGITGHVDHKFLHLAVRKVFETYNIGSKLWEIVDESEAQLSLDSKEGAIAKGLALSKHKSQVDTMYADGKWYWVDSTGLVQIPEPEHYTRII